MDIFDLFQLVALVLFLAIFLGRTIILRVTQGVRVVVLVAGKGGLGQLVELAFFAGLVAWIIEVALYATDSAPRLFLAPLDTLLIDSVAFKIAGMVLIVIGLAVFILSLTAFGRSWRIGIDTTAPGDLVTGGVFGVTRNPIFLFIDLYFAGTFLINGTLIFLIFAVAVIIGMHYQILQEEHFLAGQYGAAYTQYRDRVGRYLTLRWA